MSFTIDILSFYPYQIQPRMRDLDFFPPTILPVPSALLPENPSILEGRMEAYRQGLRGKTSQGCCWEGKELECRVTLSSISLHPVNSNSYAYIHLPGQGQPGQHQQQHIQRCPCNREASASLPRVPFPWQVILCSLGIQFRNNSPNLSPFLSCLFSFSPRN